MAKIPVTPEINNKQVPDTNYQQIRNTGLGNRGATDTDAFLLNTTTDLQEGSGLFDVIHDANLGTRYVALKKIKMDFHFYAGAPTSTYTFFIYKNRNVGGTSVIIAKGCGVQAGGDDIGGAAGSVILDVGENLQISRASAAVSYNELGSLIVAESLEPVSLGDL